MRLKHKEVGRERKVTIQGPHIAGQPRVFLLQRFEGRRHQIQLLVYAVQSSWSGHGRHEHQCLKRRGE